MSILDYLERSREALDTATADPAFAATIDKIVHCTVRADETAIIQQLDITAAHNICGLVEERLFPRVAATFAVE